MSCCFAYAGETKAGLWGLEPRNDRNRGRSKRNSGPSHTHTKTQRARNKESIKTTRLIQRCSGLQPASRQATCKRCRAEASMKIENRKKENAGSMEGLELTHSARERQRERNTETLISK